METALWPTRFIDSDHPVAREFAARYAGAGGPLEKAFYPRLLAHLEAERMKNPQDARRNGDSI